MKKLSMSNKAKKIVTGVATVATVATVGGVAYNSTIQPNADGGSWEGTGNYHDATWKSQDGSVWTNVHHDISVPMGATNEQIINQIGLPTVTSADGEKAKVTYEFNWNDGKGKPTQIQFYYQFNGGQKRIGANTGIQRQPVQPSISAKDGKTSISTPVGHPIDILSLVSTSSNNGDETPKLSIYNDGGLNWNEPGLYTVQVESKDSYNYPAYLTFTVHVTGNDDNNTDKPVNPGTPGEGQGKVTTRYVDQNGNKIHADNVEVGYKGTPYQTAPIGKAGYKLVATKGQEKGVITDGGNVVVTYVYASTSTPVNPDKPNGGNTDKPVNPNGGNTPDKPNGGNTDNPVNPNGGSNTSDSSLPKGSTSESMNGVVIVIKNGGTNTYINASSHKSSEYLDKGSEWRTNKKVTLSDGSIYYQVSKDGYVKASDVTLKNSSRPTTGNIQETHGVAVITAKVMAHLYTDDLQQVTNRGLGTQSAWLVDKIKTTSDGETLYRVATNEWVKSSDVSFKTVDTGSTSNMHSISKTVKVNGGGYSIPAYSNPNQGLAGHLNDNSIVHVKSETKSGSTTWLQLDNGAWINAKDVTYVDDSSTNNPDGTPVSFKGTGVVKGNYAELYLNFGSKAAHVRNLAKNSAWLISKKVTDKHNTTWYLVGKNEWVKASDIALR